MSEAIGGNVSVPLLQRAYALVADLWCNPGHVEVEQVRQEAEGVVRALKEIDQEAASLLARFLADYPPPEEEYVELFELNPRCPLYLGSHAFEEPKTCAQAAVSDRNEYMLDLIGLYRHFGLGLKGKELPDYLPLMVEALALTADTQDPIRTKLIEEYILPFLPPLRSRLEALGTPYLHLLDGLERLLKLDQEVRGRGMVNDG
jgi:nitrate reductase delta subunit